MGTEFGTGFGDGEAGDFAGRIAAQQAVSNIESDSADFAVVFCSPTYDCETVIEGVKSIIGEADLVGATSEGEFTEQGIHTSGFRSEHGVTTAVVASDEMQFFTGLGRNVSEDPEASVAEATAALPDVVEGYPHLTGLFLSSALFGQEELALIAYQELPIQWAGGGANDINLENVTVFVGDETAADAIALTVIASKRPFALGVGNRHEPIDGSFKVTKSDEYVVHELDGDPAYEVWKQAFDETAHERYGFHIEDIEHDRRHLFRALEEMVFGIRTGEDEYKIRSPGMTALFEPYTNLRPGQASESEEDHPITEFPALGTLEEGALQFAHPIPEGVTVYPMTSGEQGTINRGTQSARHALGTIGESQVAGGLVFDCPCAEVTLQDDYSKLIDVVARAVDAPIAGMQSGGQICFRRDDMRGVHETATSLLLFPGGEDP